MREVAMVVEIVERAAGERQDVDIGGVGGQHEDPGSVRREAV
jgi:hypothetical protein